MKVNKSRMHFFHCFACYCNSTMFLFLKIHEVLIVCIRHQASISQWYIIQKKKKEELPGVGLIFSTGFVRKVNKNGLESETNKQKMAVAIPPTLSVMVNTWSLNDFPKLLSKGLRIPLQKLSLILPYYHCAREKGSC